MFLILEQVHIVSSSKEKAEEKEKATSMRAALETQMDQLRDVHHKQVKICIKLSIAISINVYANCILTINNFTVLTNLD